MDEKVFSVELVTWVTVHAIDRWQAREIAAERLQNGQYNSSFEGFATIESVVEETRPVQESKED